jgi:hypothetical protein
MEFRDKHELLVNQTQPWAQISLKNFSPELGRVIEMCVKSLPSRAPWRCFSPAGRFQRLLSVWSTVVGPVFCDIN